MQQMISGDNSSRVSGETDRVQVRQYGGPGAEWRGSTLCFKDNLWSRQVPVRDRTLHLPATLHVRCGHQV